MPRTYNLSTDEQIARIRSSLLPPRSLFASIEELFESARTRGVDHRAASKKEGKAKKAWTCDGGMTKVLAHTKGEARAIWKKENGKIPAGVKFTHG